MSNLSAISDNPKIETTLEPLALLDELQDIENSMGRKKVIEKGPRNIDLDILLYEDYVIKHERLGIPHIGIAEREFVLRPLAEYIYFPSQANPLLTRTPQTDSPPSNLSISTLENHSRFSECTAPFPHAHVHHHSSRLKPADYSRITA
jgi:hypothetical protein